MTETSAPAPEAGTARRRRFQPRHAAYLALLALVVVCVVVLVQRSSSDATNLDGGAIERLIPTPGSKILQQDEVGIDLAPGYEGSLALNGTPIPDDQLLIVPQLNQITFDAGTDIETTLLPAQQNCVVATYWLSSTGPDQSSTQSWCFTVL